MDKAAVSISCRFLSGYTFSTLLGEYQATLLLGCMSRMFSFIRTVLQSGCSIFHSYQQHMSVSVALSAFGVVGGPDFGLSDSCVVKSHFCLNLHFPDDP